jgi:hypothetical protein
MVMDVDKRLNLRRTAVDSHYLFQPPPDDFIAWRASEEELTKYGLPHQPDPKKLPREARVWLRTMKKLQRYVTPELRVIKKGGSPLSAGPVPAVGNGNSTITAPALSGLATVFNAPFLNALGTWNVPAVLDPYSGWNIAMWAGIQSNTTNNLVQAGTMETDVFSVNFNPLGSPDNFSYQAWCGWFPGPAVALGGFSISPGQTFSVNLQSSNNGCQVAFLNKTTGQWTSIFMTSPSVDCNGVALTPPPFPTDQVEWIMEACYFDSHGCVADNPYGFLQFGETTLTCGGVVSILGSGLNLTSNSIVVGVNDGGTLINMVAPDGSTMCSTQKTPGLVWTYGMTPIYGE